MDQLGGHGHAPTSRSPVPASVAELQRVVARRAAGTRVKPIGAGHSFTAIGATDGVQLRPDRLSGVVRADVETGLVTVLAGTRLHELNEALWHLGLALREPRRHRRADRRGRDLDRHARHRRAARRAGHPGPRAATRPRRRRRLLRRRRRELFAAARSGSARSASIATVTLQCEPAFALAAAEAPAPLDDVLADLDTTVDGNDHFEFYWFPHTRRVLTKRNNRVLPRHRARAARPAARPTSTTSSCPTPCSTRINRLTTRRPGADPARQRDRGAGAVGARLHRPLLPGVRLAAAGACSARWSTPCRARPCRTCCAEIEAGSPAAASRSASRSRCASPRPTTSGCRPRYGRDTGYIAVHQYHRRDHERVLPRRRGDRARRRRPAALGQAALPRRRVAGRDLPALRRFRRAARPARPDAHVRQRLPRTVLGLTTSGTNSAIRRRTGVSVPEVGWEDRARDDRDPREPQAGGRTVRLGAVEDPRRGRRPTRRPRRSAPAIARLRSRTSSRASAPGCATCSRCRTAGRSCSATAARPRSGTSPRSG